jgi:subtilisin family serine protease
MVNATPPPGAAWYPPPPGSYPPPGWSPPPPDGAGAIVAAVFAGLLAAGVTVGAQGIAWLVDQVLLATGIPLPGWVWPATSLVNAVLVGLPALLLAMIPRSTAVRMAGRAWLTGAVVLGALGLLRAVPQARNEVYLAGLAAAAALGAVALRRLRRKRPAEPAGSPAEPGDAAPPHRGGAALALASGMLVLLPWLWVGAAGGLTETVLALLAAAAVAWLAAETLDARFWAPYANGGTARRVLLGGLVAGVALLLIGAAVGGPGPHLAVLMILPAAGFAIAALERRATTWSLVVPVLFGPLAMVDPEEVSLLLIGRDVPFWAMVATAASVGIALVVGAVLALVARPSLPRLVGAVTAVIVLGAATAVYAGAGQPGLHGDRLFVVLREQASLAGLPAGAGPEQRAARVRAVYDRLVTHAEQTQADLRRELDGLRLSYTPYYLVNAIEVDAGPGVHAWLSRRADVDRVLLSQRLRPVPGEPSTERGHQLAPAGTGWNISMVGADRAWTELGVRGAGVVVGTSDSGVDGSHPALADGFRGGEDSWYDPWNATATPVDRGGHGTHTLGSAVGGEGIGVAPDAQWIGCVNLDRNLGSPARYLDCLQFMLAPFARGGDPFGDGRPERAPHVLTNSWGCPPIEGCDANALRPATAALAAAGVFFVAAAGNTGPRCDSIDDPPAPYADVLTVGAVDQERQVTGFSSRGPTDDGRPKPDVVAPGDAILSALPGGGYGELAGTSMATPHVAGVVALMWSANPALVGDIARTRQLLRETAVDLDPPAQSDCGGGDNLDGAGLVDAYAAVRAAQGVG